jgi:hypothetical protein
MCYAHTLLVFRRRVLHVIGRSDSFDAKGFVRRRHGASQPFVFFSARGARRTKKRNDSGVEDACGEVLRRPGIHRERAIDMFDRLLPGSALSSGTRAGRGI